MLSNIVRKLTGNEAKLFLVILTESDARHEYGNLEKLMHFNMTAPTVYKSVDNLEKYGYIKKFDQGQICILRVAKEFFHLAEYLKKMPTDLVLIDEPQKEKKSQKWWTHEDCKKIINHYARERFKIDDSELTRWWKSCNPQMLMVQAKRLLDFCQNIEEAKEVITNCRMTRERDRMTWSLGGDVLNNIGDYAPKLKKDGQKQWH